MAPTVIETDGKSRSPRAIYEQESPSQSFHTPVDFSERRQRIRGHSVAACSAVKSVEAYIPCCHAQTLMSTTLTTQCLFEIPQAQKIIKIKHNSGIGVSKVLFGWLGKTVRHDKIAQWIRGPMRAVISWSRLSDAIEHLVG